MPTLFCEDGRQYEVESIPLDGPSPCACKWRPQWSSVYNCFGHPNIPGHCYTQKSGGYLLMRRSGGIAKFNGTDERESCRVCTPFEVSQHCGPLGDGQEPIRVFSAGIPHLDMSNPDAYVIRPAGNSRYLVVSDGVKRWAAAGVGGTPACYICRPAEIPNEEGDVICTNRHHTCRAGRLAISGADEDRIVEELPAPLCDGPIDPYCGENCSFEYDEETGLPLAELHLTFEVDDTNAANYTPNSCVYVRTFTVVMPVYSFDGCETVYRVEGLTLEELNGETYAGSGLDFDSGGFPTENDFAVEITYVCSTTTGSWVKFRLFQKRRVMGGLYQYVALWNEDDATLCSTACNCCFVLYANNQTDVAICGYAGCAGGLNCVTISGEVVPL